MSDQIGDETGRLVSRIADLSVRLADLESESYAVDLELENARLRKVIADLRKNGGKTHIPTTAEGAWTT